MRRSPRALTALLFLSVSPALAQQEMFPGAAQAGYPITLANGKIIWAPATYSYNVNPDQTQSVDQKDGIFYAPQTYSAVGQEKFKQIVEGIDTLWINVQTIGGGDTFQLRGTLDGTSWYPCPASTSDNTFSGTASNTIAMTGLYKAQKCGYMMELIQQGHTSGSTYMLFYGSKSVAGVNPPLTDVAGSGPNSFPSTENPLLAAGHVSTSAPDITYVSGDRAWLNMTNSGELVMTTNGTPQLRWYYAAPSGGLSNTTTPVTIATNANASLVTVLTYLSISCTSLGAATGFIIQDSAATPVVLMRHALPAGSFGPVVLIAAGGELVTSAANLQLTARFDTAVTGACDINASGYRRMP